MGGSFVLITNTCISIFWHKDKIEYFSTKHMCPYLDPYFSKIPSDGVGILFIIIGAVLFAVSAGQPPNVDAAT
eukprot:UN29059